MMINAVLSNPHHPDYGVVTIPFPIPHDQYAHCMELLEALEVGDAVKADCKVAKIDSFYTVLKRMEMQTVNIDELNYLAKLLERFNDYEAAQFQALAHKLELFTPKDFINLNFCCQQATVITDFSDLAAADGSVGAFLILLLGQLNRNMSHTLHRAPVSSAAKSHTSCEVLRNHHRSS